MSFNIERRNKRFLEKQEEKAYIKSLQSKGKKIVDGKVIDAQKPYIKEKN